MRVAAQRRDASAQRFTDFLQFSRGLLATQDHDPIYPLLAHVALPFSEEARLWLIALYGYWYNTASAWYVFTELGGSPRAFNRKQFVAFEAQHRAVLKLNTERRGLRGGAVVPAVLGYLDALGGATQREWLDPVLQGDPETNYLALWDRLQTLPWVGRWAAFKMLDLYQHVAKLPILPPDMRLGSRYGPKQGLEELYWGPGATFGNDAAHLMRLDTLAQEVQTWLRAWGVEAEWDVLETLLCKFHATAHGVYYIGHDIDDHLHATVHGPGDQSAWHAARAVVLPDRTLGERHGWAGVRPLKSLYKKEGRLHCDLWT